MPPRIFELSLTGFSFPTNLDNSKANFRFVVDIRYVNKNDEFATEHAVMPGLDTFWECDTREDDKPNYVRAIGAATFDMAKINEWDRLILLFKANDVHSIQFKVFDVNRQDIWDRIKEIAVSLLQALIGKVQSVVSSTLPAAVSSSPGSLGNAAEDLVSHILKRIAKSGDDVLFKGATNLTIPPGAAPTRYTIRGAGSRGNYEIDFQLKCS